MATEQFVLFIFICCLSSQFADGYDPVDPNGNITINWDFPSIEPNVYVKVSIHNYQLYRHIERPGWRLSWVWAGDEFISDVIGAETTERGNCTGRHGANGAPPHCCEKQPVMADLLPGAPYNRQSANCCRGGVLSSVTQNNRTATSQFDMYIVNFALDEHGDPKMPTTFSIGVPGYTCSNATNVPATRSKVDEQRCLTPRALRPCRSSGARSTCARSGCTGT
uniref:COBRA-like protein n=1 Tax=Aegilops tauschii subsp. strangulata TaxID=200361 RepID=A0A453CJE1_AEGTS